MNVKFKNIDEELYDHIIWILTHRCEEYQNKYDDDFRKVLDACLNEYISLLSEEIWKAPKYSSTKLVSS